MARTSILTTLSIILGFGVPALSVYSSAQYGFNFIVAGIISIFALIVAGILTVLGIVLGVPVLGRLFRKGRLYTTDIVAEERVCLENVVCDNISGRVMILGEGCDISGKVKYSESVSTRPAAKLAHAPEKASMK